MAEELKVPLSQIPGVMEAELHGEYQREFHVYLDPEKMNGFGVSFEEISAALQDANVSIPAGDFTDSSGEYDFCTRSDSTTDVGKTLSGMTLRVRSTEGM